jgi:glycerol-3-phosphate dehydrogenase
MTTTTPMSDSPPAYDLAIIGGGINGMGIARDAAGRGLSVFLCEKGDFGGATSSASTKLVHGGLRYLEQFEFGLVRESLAERETLLKIAPHLVQPLRFILPHHAGLRPRWMLRLGLFLYDRLARVSLPRARALDLGADSAGAALQSCYRYAFAYPDCTVDDSRLVMVNAIDARARGADLVRSTECVAAERRAECWRLTLRDRRGVLSRIEARALVNAAGPWVGTVAERVLNVRVRGRLRLDKGSHIVVNRLFGHDDAYTLQNADGRVVFAIPYARDFTLIGTTEEDYRGDPAAASINAAEIDYLCAIARKYFRAPVTRDQIVWTYSGVRPLYAEPGKRVQDVSRDYVLERDMDGAPLLTLYGGKLTTYRRLAETALARLAPHLPMGTPWTADAVLPGGDFTDGLPGLAEHLRHSHPFVSPAEAERIARAYGTRAALILGAAHNESDLGRRFGAALSEAEVRYLMREEWAESANDVIWRRSKLGLTMTADAIAALSSFMDAVRAGEPAQRHA